MIHATLCSIHSCYPKKTNSQDSCPRVNVVHHLPGRRVQTVTAFDTLTISIHLQYLYRICLHTTRLHACGVAGICFRITSTFSRHSSEGRAVHKSSWRPSCSQTTNAPLLSMFLQHIPRTVAKNRSIAENEARAAVLKARQVWCGQRQRLQAALPSHFA
jgi:hypothetical protein